MSEVKIWLFYGYIFEVLFYIILFNKNDSDFFIILKDTSIKILSIHARIIKKNKGGTHPFINLFIKYQSK